jgi:hypothetical protein
VAHAEDTRAGQREDSQGKNQRNEAERRAGGTQPSPRKHPPCGAAPPTPPIRTMTTSGVTRSVSLSLPNDSMPTTTGWKMVRERGLAVFGIR